MLTVQDLQHALTSHLVAGSMSDFQHANMALLHQHFDNYSYRDFRADSHRATAPLNTVQQLLSYQSYYAQEHFDRITHLLATLRLRVKFANDCQDRLNIFDYGCGQGLATLALLLHLLKDLPVRGLNIHLVEPSAQALALAKHYVTHVAQAHMTSQVSVYAHCCSIDDLPQDFFAQTRGQNVMHLFSNVLDLAPQGYYDLGALVRRWRAIEGRQLILGVGPTHAYSAQGMQQLMHLTHAKRVVEPVRFDIESGGYRAYGNSPASFNRHLVSGRMIALKCEKNHFA